MYCEQRPERAVLRTFDCKRTMKCATQLRTTQSSDRVLIKHTSGCVYNGCQRLNADLAFIDFSLVKLAAKLFSREVRNDDYALRVFKFLQRNTAF